MIFGFCTYTASTLFSFVFVHGTSFLPSCLQMVQPRQIHPWTVERTWSMQMTTCSLRLSCPWKSSRSPSLPREGAFQPILEVLQLSFPDPLGVPTFPGYSGLVWAVIALQARSSRDDPSDLPRLARVDPSGRATERGVSDLARGFPAPTCFSPWPEGKALFPHRGLNAGHRWTGGGCSAEVCGQYPQVLRQCLVHCPGLRSKWTGGVHMFLLF